MNILIAQIVKLITDLLQGFISALKLKKLKETLTEKKDVANELKSKSDSSFSDFMSEYNKFLDSEESELPESTEYMQGDSRESSKQSGSATEDDRRASRGRRSKRARNNRARRANKSRTKK